MTNNTIWYFSYKLVRNGNLWKKDWIYIQINHKIVWNLFHKNIKFVKKEKRVYNRSEMWSN